MRRTSTQEVKSPFRWTASKSDLVELLRGMIDMRSINDGDATYEEFIPFMSRLLHQDLKNHKNLYNNISKRTGDEANNFSRITYVQKMADLLNHKLEVLDIKKSKR